MHIRTYAVGPTVGLLHLHATKGQAHHAHMWCMSAVTWKICFQGSKVILQIAVCGSVCYALVCLVTVCIPVCTGVWACTCVCVCLVVPLSSDICWKVYWSCAD